MTTSPRPVYEALRDAPGHLASTAELLTEGRAPTDAPAAHALTPYGRVVALFSRDATTPLNRPVTTQETRSLERERRLRDRETDATNPPDLTAFLQQAAQDSRALLSALGKQQDWVVLNIQTTGTDQHADIVEVAVTTAAGQPLLRMLTRPTHPVPAAATDVHGLDDHALRGALPWADVHAHLQQVLTGRTVLIWNAAFTLFILHWHAARHGTPIPDAQYLCAMRAYAPLTGDWLPQKRTFKFLPLPHAAAHAQITPCGQFASHALNSACTAAALLRAHQPVSA
ncbi:3'-5' exonuclease [Deinococcus soli (ex Cha et al. 2016)]|uniref:DNA polymerase III epsilon subunit-like protein n=2 Tax=Deinococcus soli (ex Cha et al. 2016) TaxID=1309411 RepID=A0AAE3XAL2_9DEIO|nr:3'-5' exonuclease [Deinococcus soli (ex Cha et al. 2016)]MDR6218220.1 DNA polymerase III epsilon subunit-like protein [Deinococcus soli (ex Cha et al. 2016)]MDR6328960.1 DNA polymerase III epsilon subunit-like protein [Deinococcus soli (ex Cha et al. 2016)]MDR6751233.1 DNA polymerase III epsilon subunit-like protein [Deinococcus soli (ex Cha et al. 2016)]